MDACKSLRIALAKKGWTQRRLAQETGLSNAAISRLANNQNWSCDSLKRIAETLDLKVSEFISLGEE